MEQRVTSVRVLPQQAIALPTAETRAYQGSINLFFHQQCLKVPVFY
jgi:hypothetical protein